MNDQLQGWISKLGKAFITIHDGWDNEEGLSMLHETIDEMRAWRDSQAPEQIKSIQDDTQLA